MKHNITLLGAGMALAGAMLFAGCSTIEISSAGAMHPDERLLTIQSNGIALVDSIPLWSGTVKVDARGVPQESFAMFCDKTNSDDLYAAAQEIAKRQNCELTNVFFTNGYQGLNIANFYGLFTVYDTSVSAVLKSK